MIENTTETTGIRRIDNPLTRTHSWHVSIQRRKKIITRHFSDGVYGGEEESYQAALAFWHETDQAQPQILRMEYADILRKNNTSGVPGVSKHKSDGREYWNARWPTSVGESKSAKFSVAKYGDQKAFELALAARKAGLENLDEPYKNKRRYFAIRHDGAGLSHPTKRLPLCQAGYHSNTLHGTSNATASSVPG
jgi:hypothetical protein